MAESNKLTFEKMKITEQDIKANGIQALANRPNKSSQYGQSGLSATELKKWFDNLASLIAGKVNGIAEALEGENAAKYIDVNFSTIETLYDLVQSIQNGSFVDGELKIKISEAIAQNGLEVDKTVALQYCLESLFSHLFNKFDDLVQSIQDGSLAEKLKINNTELNSLKKEYLDDIIDKILQLIKRKAELTLKNLLIVPDEPIDYVYGVGGTPMLDLETGEYRTTFEPRAAINTNFADARYGSKISTSYNNSNGKLKIELKDNAGKNVIASTEVDLPLESSIVSIDEEEQDNKIYLKLTLASGNETLIELDDIIRGFVSKETFDAKISELTNAINGVEESLRQLNEGGIV